MTIRRRTLRAGPALLAVVLAATMAPPAATAAPPGTTPPVTASPVDGKDAAANTFTLTGVRPGNHQITLVTGDRVTLFDTGRGRYRISATPATRADGTTPSSMDIRQSGSGVYAIPSDAFSPIAAKRLDRELFNVRYLAEHGYTDATSTAVPLIVQYPGGGAAARALPTSRPPKALPSIGATSLAVPKNQVGTFWNAVRDPADPAPTKARQATAPKVWLDRLATVTLAESVPQVGAPQAWAAGHDGTGAKVAVLDTGVDPNHPDFAGRIVATESFVPGIDVTDRHGHGTHVAATVAGTGAASGGRRKGVAPGAQLLIGKVCDNSGQCPFSAMISGMEWAAAQGVDVVSMSVGGDPSDGTDPLSQAVNQLTATTGTLFVIAAGNRGSGEFTVTTPGAADAALTVGAVSKANQLAAFSGRGPRGPRMFGDYAIKPEITAPGVQIVAARAAGTQMGQPVDEHYTAANGTSMATPHVAGAAAILAAQHPDWSPDDLKATLVSTATDGGYTVYQQGGGRLDVARASRQQVRVAPATLDFRAYSPGRPEPEPKTLTYTNPTGSPVTLDLSATVKTTVGGAADGVFSLSTSQLTVPAGGTATVTATVDLGRAVVGTTYTGRVVASAPDGTQLTTPVGFTSLPKTHRLTVVTPLHADSDCAPDPCARQTDLFNIWGVAGPALGYTEFVAGGNPGDDLFDGRHTFYVPEGTYQVTAQEIWYAGNERQYGYLIDPEVAVTGDTELVLDPNRARPITVSTPRPNEWFTSEMRFCRTDSARYTGCALLWAKNPWVLPTEPVHSGANDFEASWFLGAPPVTMTLAGADRIDLRPVMRSYDDQVMKQWPAGTRTLRVVDVGAGKPEDYAKVDVRGALAFQRRCYTWKDHVERAAAAGAVGLITATYPLKDDKGCQLWRFPDFTLPAGVPVAQIPPPQTATLLERMAEGPVTIEVTGSPDTPYLYNLTAPGDGGVPASVDYRFTDEDLAVVDNHLHAAAPTWFQLQDNNFRLDSSIWAGATGAVLRGPRTVREYIAPVSTTTLHWRQVTVADGDTGALCNLGNFRYGRCEQAVEVFGDRNRRDAHWNVDPTSVGAPTVPADAAQRGLPALCAGCREGDAFYALTNLTTAEPNHWRGYVDATQSETHLYRDGVEVPGTPYNVTVSPFEGAVNRYQLPAGPAAYRLTQQFDDTSTTWSFKSQGVTSDQTPAGTACVQAYQSGTAVPCRAEPLVFLRYDTSVGMDNSLPAPGVSLVRVTAYHQAPDAPRIAGLHLWYSLDGGTTWRQTLALPTGGGAYYAALPLLGQTDGAISLRAKAWDSAGNQVEQTILDAITLRDRR